MSDLATTLRTVRERIERYSAKGINEQDTKAALIQPVLRALGWDVEDLDDVQREYRRGKKDMPVDYALLLLRTPRLFVEAKSLGENLDDRKWANQIMTYASVAGVEWVVLTDGNEYRLYNSHATVPIEEKLFRTVRVSDDPERAAETLALLSKDRIQEREIDVLWKAHFVDRQVRAAIEGMFGEEPDPKLVRLIARCVGTLTAGEVRASLRRAEIGFDFPVKPSDGIVRHRVLQKDEEAGHRQKRAPSSKGMRRIKPVAGLVYLNDLLEAGILRAPLKLIRKYKGTELTATVRADGKVVFHGEEYDTPSTAAEFARGTVTGRRMATNGWSFWQYENADGHLVELDVARKEFRKRKGK